MPSIAPTNSSQRHPERIVPPLPRRWATAAVLALGLIGAASCHSLRAATYYIDFEAGLDTNSGKSRAEPWKRHPFMKGWSGTYSHSPGDRYIFKGGVVWPNTTLPLDVASGGSRTTGNNYYGVDRDWYAGAEWTRPVLDGEYRVSDCIRIGNRTHLTFDGLEVRRVSSSANFGYGLISGGGAAEILIDNCHLYGWRTTNARDDAHGGVIFSFHGPGVDTIVIDRTEIENRENLDVQWNGVCVRAVGTIRRSKIHSNSSGVLFCLDFDRSELHNIGLPKGGFDPNYHLNGVYLDPSTLGKSRGYIRNSYLYDVGGAANMAYPNVRAGAIVYVYNNVFHGAMSAQLAIQIEPYNYANEGPGHCYVWNNTIANSQSGRPAIRVVGRPVKLGSLSLENNHIIGVAARISDASPATVRSLTSSNNLIQTPAEAAAFGLTAATRFRPDRDRRSPAVDAGTDTPASIFTEDIVGVKRPAGRAWDIGAYESPTDGSFTQNSARISNLSLLARVAPDEPLILGLSVPGAKSLLLRAGGPALSQLGVSGYVSDPRLAVYAGETLSLENDNWDPALSTEFARVGAYPFPPSSLDAAIQFQAAGNYSLQVEAGNTGVVLAEAYESDPNSLVQFSNLSCLARIEPQHPLIAGLALSGSGSRKVLVRAVGPGLGTLGISDFLPDPRVAIFDQRANLIAQNEVWNQLAAPTFAETGAFPLTYPSNDSVLISHLPAPSNYTIQVTSPTAASGAVLLELYTFPN